MRRRSAQAAVAVAALALSALAGIALAGQGAPVAGPGAIAVHGHWTLVVRNRHGEIVARRRFENALTSQGADDLVNILGRAKVVGRWAVGLLAEPVGYGDCTGSSIDCWMSTEPDWGDISFAKGGTFKTLTMTPHPGTGSELTLAGNVTVAADTTITRVDSYLLTCGPATALGACGTTNQTYPDVFTTRALSPGLAIAAGAQVSITVNFSFS